MADAPDSKSGTLKGVWVQVPPSVLSHISSCYFVFRSLSLMKWKPKTCKVETLGCKVNQYESQFFREMLELNGVVEALENEIPDLCIINTCTVTHDADAKGRSLIRKIHTRNPNTKILVTGCYAERDPNSLKNIDGVSSVIGNKETFLSSLSEFGISQRPPNISRFDDHQRAFVKVQDGCLLNCSYCIIPSVRPALISRNPDSIIDEIADLELSGYREIVLTGIHLGHYGIDLSKGKPKVEWCRLWHLLQKISSRFPTLRIRLSSIEAAEARDDLIDVMKSNPLLAPHFHLCLQSGSDEILRKMRRRYTSQGFIDRCERIASSLDRPGFSTDIIIGFPGETNDDFELTCELSKKIGFFKMHLFPYSPREGTPAASLDDPVPPQVKLQRRKVLEQIEKENLLKYQECLLGIEEQILVESNSTIRPGWVEGTSSRGIRVMLPGMIEALRRKLIPVQINGIHQGILESFPLPESNIMEPNPISSKQRMPLALI